MLYLDSSAIVKLIRVERESKDLQVFLLRSEDDRSVTSSLSRVEVTRSMFGVDPKYVDQMKHQFNRIGQILMTEEVLTRAASMLLERQLRSLDAIHLASALTVGSDLKSVVTYDTRMANAARELGMAVSSPGA